MGVCGGGGGGGGGNVGTRVATTHSRPHTFSIWNRTCSRKGVWGRESGLVCHTNGTATPVPTSTCTARDRGMGKGASYTSNRTASHTAADTVASFGVSSNVMAGDRWRGDTMGDMVTSGEVPR